MSFYSKLADTANGQLKRFGQKITIAKKSGTYSTATSSVTNVISTYEGIGMVLDYGNHAIDGALVKTGDKQLILSPIDTEKPDIGDIVTVTNGVYTVTMVKEISPAGTPVLYECNLRGA